MKSNLSRIFFLSSLFVMLEIQASELIINLSDQKKAGTLMLAIYNNAEAFEGSVVKEKRSEVGVFKGLELIWSLRIQPSSVLKFQMVNMQLHFLSMQMEIKNLIKTFLVSLKNNTDSQIMLWELYLPLLLSKLNLRLLEIQYKILNSNNL